MSSNLSVNIGKLTLRNPVMTASGTFGYAQEYLDFVDLNRLGAIIVKGISLKTMQGNPPPRICETPCGIINAIGLQNVGLKRFLKEKLPFLKTLNTKFIVNILGNSISDYVKLSKSLEDAGIEAVELNVSCPNVKKGGIAFGTNEKLLAKLISKVRQSAKHITIITKLSPNVSSIPAFAKIAEDEGSDAISLINTIPALAIDIETWKPKLANITGGLSGPAIKPIALRMVWEAAKTVKIPVIGVGGIMNFSDAIEFLLAGATAIQVGTGNFVNPCATIELLEGIEEYLKRKSINDIKNIIGGMNGKYTNNNTDN